MTNPQTINIADFDYPLNDNQIAKFPLKDRDQSKLLIYKNKEIQTDIFSNLAMHLPSDSLLVFNNTKVIHARLLFSKASGSQIEIFCLEPADNKTDIQLIFQQHERCEWKCFVGNNKKWKENFLVKNFEEKGISYQIKAERKKAVENAWIIEFTWDATHLCFSEVIEKLGVIPLPPYLNRESQDADNERYQTIYAAKNGSVAAPTAGLHFTEKTFESLRQKGIMSANLTLHVGAGTFKPVSSATIDQHIMHSEKVYIEYNFIETLLHNINKQIFTVGTTSTRSLESLYWFGVKLHLNEVQNQEIDILQWDAYQEKYQCNLSVAESLKLILNFMNKHEIKVLSGQTQMMILPGYQFKFIKGIITNFHQPKSTLLLLISAILGDNWKEIYQFASENNFRFLSYGDSCLFFNK